MQPFAILFVHGAGGGGWEWNIWRQVMESAGLRAEAPDLRPTAGTVEGACLEDYRAQVGSALRRLPRPRVVAGASLGGLLAAACADEADALILIDALPPAPWHREMPPRAWPARVPWGRHARLAGTRRALAGADAASALFAFRRWRDESGAVLRAAHAGVAVRQPTCPVLCFASMRDEDVPPAISEAWAAAWQASLVRTPGGHAGPLFGRDAAASARWALDWLAALPAEAGPADAGARGAQ
ncbi:alpha/beta fold hydrolase [Luteimonas abyssi]|uniref:alpha/beta fold hydrolase n=1 Tax=Luteimonas abyssi TaxID=1247514 RepID=UPI000737C8E5|nr:alpha/beta fold hydrolase [Luteimonas abyssi]